MDKEIRQVNFLEIREAAPESNIKTVGGYACRYNSPTLINTAFGDKFLEEIAPDAFKESISNRNQKALWNHDTSKPLGSVKSGTLRFKEDAEGLNYDVDIPNNSYGLDAYESIKRGDVDGSSFGFYAVEQKWAEVMHEGEKLYKRTITKGELLEVSPCTFPAYESSEINVRSITNLLVSNTDNKEIELLKLKIKIRSEL